MIQKLTFDQIEQIVELIKTYNNFAVFENDNSLIFLIPFVYI